MKHYSTRHSVLLSFLLKSVLSFCYILKKFPFVPGSNLFLLQLLGRFSSDLRSCSLLRNLLTALLFSKTNSTIARSKYPCSDRFTIYLFSSDIISLPTVPSYKQTNYDRIYHYIMRMTPLTLTRDVFEHQIHLLKRNNSCKTLDFQ